MDITRFKQIINYSSKNRDHIEAKVRDFYLYSKMNIDTELLNLMQIVRPLFRQKGYLIIEIPFADKEIGGLCYRGDVLGYTVLNSSLPKVNVRFALAHEIYHIFYQEKKYDVRVDLLNEHYYEYEEEFAANLFAGMLLMPEKSFKYMYQKFKDEPQEENDKISIIAKLMNYFQVPYMATLIRCYELELLEDGEILKKLIQVDNNEIRNCFAKLWLDDDILNATNKDDYCKLEELVKTIGERWLKEGYINERTLRKVLQNMKILYSKIRGD